MPPKHRLIPDTLAVIATLLLLAGCTDKPASPPAGGGGDGHGHAHDHPRPETFAAGMEQLQHMHDTIQTAFTDGDPDDAHHELHDVGRLLDHLPKLAKQSSLSAEDFKQLSDAAEALFDAYKKLDAHFHGKEVAYTDLADTIETNFQILVDKRALIHDDAAGDDEANHDHAAHGGGEEEHDEHDDEHDSDHDGHDDAHDEEPGASHR